MVIETAGRFLPVRELYNDPPGMRAYFIKMYGPKTKAGKQLGNLTNDDAVNFCGKGLIQLTGRGNVTRCGEALGVDLASHPDLLLQPGFSAEAFAWYWQSRDIQEQADRRDWESVRRSVQGGSAGLDHLIEVTEGLLVL